ncbi:MAG: acetylxylan esterase [Myxococcaceae bacterium]|nr:acetylxylan esterase [Myxococcaceae bacterium]
MRRAGSMGVVVAALLACEVPPRPPECTFTATTGLPDPLVSRDGACLTSPAQWPRRREELLDLFAGTIYGRAPGRPERLDFEVRARDGAAMGGAATLKRVDLVSRHQGRVHTFELLLFTPNARRPRGVFLLLSTRPDRHTDPTRVERSEYWPAEDVIARGYGIAALQTDRLAPDDRATFTRGVIELFEGPVPEAQRRRDAWKTIAAWSWGARRAMDYLETDPDVDPARVAVVGHSRGGKAALWAGAQDERFALTVSNQSGCAGAALSRRPVGETVELVNAVFPHWFADAFRRYGGREDELPVDQHELFALIAPRAVAVGSAAEDEWSDPEGEFQGLAYASPVFSLWGHAAIDPAAWPRVDEPRFTFPRGYQLRPGAHGLTGLDWQRYLDVADQLWP